jgi:hypothetical protein
LTLTFSSLQQSGFKFQFPPAKKNLFSMRANVWGVCRGHDQGGCLKSRAEAGCGGRAPFFVFGKALPVEKKPEKWGVRVQRRGKK